MKKNVLLSSIFISTFAIISVASAANIVANKSVQGPVAQKTLQEAKSKTDAEKNKAREEKIQQIDERIKNNIRKGRAVDALEQERQNVLRGLDASDLVNKEKLKKIDSQIEQLLKENKPVDELQKKRQELLDTMPDKIDYLSEDLQKVNEQISKALQEGGNIEKLEAQRKQIEKQLLELSE